MGNNITDRLKYKECNRIDAILEVLQLAKIKSEYKNNCIIIYGGKPSVNIFDSKNDHRTAMMIAVLCAFGKGDSRLYNAQAIEKSYPDFYKDYVKIGGKINVKI